ncbi:MAG TPA: hypothetical protein VMY05_00430 [Acidobacteriota bacterium]|nr:hypothetical protein [Acidobacteriota bacterium]
MYSQGLLLYCFVLSSLYLLIVSVVLRYVERKLQLTQGIASSLLESTGLGWAAINYVMEALFFAVIPTLAYGFFYLIIPLSGIRAGMAASLFAFTLGAIPALMGLSVRIKLPMPYILFMLLSLLIKLGGSLSIIGYLYSL